MTLTAAIVLALAIVVGFAAHLISKKPDSPVEEVAKAVIKAETGMTVDFNYVDAKDLENHKPD